MAADMGNAGQEMGRWEPVGKSGFPGDKVGDGCDHRVQAWHSLWTGQRVPETKLSQDWQWVKGINPPCPSVIGPRAERERESTGLPSSEDNNLRMQRPGEGSFTREEGRRGRGPTTKSSGWGPEAYPL